MPATRLRFHLLRLLAIGGLLLPAPLTSAAEPPPPPSLANGNSGQVYGGPHLSACGNNTDTTQTISSTTFVTLVECSLGVPGSGHLVVLANASVGLVDPGDSYEATFRLNHPDGVNDEGSTERTVDAYPDSGLLTNGDGTDRNVAITGYYTVTAGSQLLQLQVKRTEGTAEMEFINATLSVLFIPSDTDLLTCGVLTANGFVTGQDTYSGTIACSMDIPRPGLVFVSADGWIHLGGAGSQPYEGAARLVMDGNGGTTVRYTNVYTNTGSLSGDGVDTTLSDTQVFTVTAGVHTFTLEHRLYDGPGTVSFNNAMMAALYVPFDSLYARACGQVSPSIWLNATTTYSALATCTLETPANSWAFMSGNAGIGLSNNAYEARFGLAIDSLTAASPSSRFVNSYPDAPLGDGLDGQTVVSLILPSLEGTHTYRLVGRRYGNDAATVLARTGVVFVLVPQAPVFLPLVVR